MVTVCEERRAVTARVRRFIAALVVLKALVLVFNVATFPTKRQHDARHHGWRARSAGLEVGKMAYNSPLYYLPVLPWVDVSRFYEDGKPKVHSGPYAPDFELLERLQWLNVVYVLGALLVWIYGILPMVASSERAWLLAALLLLALPGFPKIAMSAHPDVLLLFLSSLTFFLTFRWLDRTPRFGRNLVLAVLAGLTGATRPFAIVPMLLSWSLNVGMLVRDAIAQVRLGAATKMASASCLLVKLSVVTVIVAVLSGSWWLFRYVHTGEVLNAYKDYYMERFEPLKEDYDYVHYYSTFYFGKLLDVPSRADVSSKPNRQPKGNSFWTQLYSDFWGDHFLYYSGHKKGVESKLWPKRMLFVLALPLSLLLWFGILAGTVRAFADAMRRRVLLHPSLYMAATFWGGFIIFMAWQGTAGLLPGKNSTIKFLYIAWAVPFGIGTAASLQMGSRLFWVLFGLELAVAIVALPVSMSWPWP